MSRGIGIDFFFITVDQFTCTTVMRGPDTATVTGPGQCARSPAAPPATLCTIVGVPRKTIPIGEFLDVYRPPTTDTWDELFEVLDRDPSEAWIVERLTEQLRRDGNFVNAVVVDPGDLMLCNGCHRVRATVAAGFATIDIDDSPAGDEPQSRYVDVIVVPVDGWTFDAAWPEGADTDLFDVTFGTARSFPVGEVWVEADTMSCQGGRCSVLYTLPAGWDPDLLVEAVNARLAAAGVPVAATGWEPFEFAD